MPKKCQNHFGDHYWAAIPMIELLHCWSYQSFVASHWICHHKGTLSYRQKAINSLWPSDVIWWQGSRSTLARVMACCRQTNVDLSPLKSLSSESIIMRRSEDTAHKNKIFKITFTSPRDQWVNKTYLKFSISWLVCMCSCFTTVVSWRRSSS